jgi:hypothetical protein
LDLPFKCLYMLAAPSTPEEARETIIERAQAGEPVSIADVKQTIETVRRGIVTSAPMHPYAERGLDLYQTPAPATRALLAAEPLDGSIWEPANGRGAISDVLRAAGFHVIATDLADYGVQDARGGVDFLAQTAAPDGVTTILTNPPFMYAQRIRAACTHACSARRVLVAARFPRRCGPVGHHRGRPTCARLCLSESIADDASGWLDRTTCNQQHNAASVVRLERGSSGPHRIAAHFVGRRGD